MDDRLDKATEQALRFLKYSDRTVHEMKEKLQAKGYSDQIVQRATAKLKRLGLLDDARFTERWIRGKLRSRPIGTRLIEHQLRLKGVHPELIAEIVQPLYKEFVEAYGIEKLVAKQLRKYKSLEIFKLKKKLFDFLMRRGFDYGECVSAIEHAISVEEDPQSPEQ